MAKKSDIQYIRLYTDGSAARSIEFEPPQKPKRVKQPKPQKVQTVLIRLDPIALAGIVVACVMLLLMGIGVNRLVETQSEVAAMRQQVTSLEHRQIELQAEYEAGYDLERIEEMALSLGLVPVEQVQHVAVSVEETQPVQESFWDRILTFLS